MVKAQVYQKQCETAVCTIVLAKSKLLYLQKKKDNKSSVISDKEGKMPFFCKILPPSQNTSHLGIQNLSPKTSHPTLFRKCMCMQESISAKYV